MELERNDNGRLERESSKRKRKGQSARDGATVEEKRELLTGRETGHGLVHAALLAWVLSHSVSDWLLAQGG